jgi:hypothetical protein
LRVPLSVPSVRTRSSFYIIAGIRVLQIQGHFVAGNGADDARSVASSRIPDDASLSRTRDLIIVDDTKIEQPSTFFGQHGYDPKLPEMKAIFYGAGPDFDRRRLKDIDAVDVAPTVAELLGIQPPRDGRGRRLVTPTTATSTDRAAVSTGRSSAPENGLSQGASITS